MVDYALNSFKFCVLYRISTLGGSEVQGYYCLRLFLCQTRFVSFLFSFFFKQGYFGL